MHTSSIFGVIENEVEKTIGRAIAIDQTLPHSWTAHTFNKKLIQISETRCIARLSTNGEVLKEGEKFTDYYGFLTSFSDPLETAFGWSKKYDCGMDRPFKVEVALMVDRHYGLRADVDVIGRPQYMTIPDDWVDCTDPSAASAMESWMNEADWRRKIDLREQLSFVRDWKPSLELTLWSSDWGTPQESVGDIAEVIRSVGRDLLSQSDLKKRVDYIHEAIEDVFSLDS